MSIIICVNRKADVSEYVNETNVRLMRRVLKTIYPKVGKDFQVLEPKNRKLNRNM